VGAPMFTNKDISFVNKADPSVRAELYPVETEFHKFHEVIKFDKIFINLNFMKFHQPEFHEIS
jgi:hypothetical protein